MKKIDEATQNKLIAAAVDARANSYSPYSGYAVGAAVLADNGVVYSGCNVENAAYPLGMCAEANAIGSMAMAGSRQIVAAAVSGPNQDLCAPCGGCRQNLREFTGPADMQIFLCDSDGGVLMETTLFTLLPNSFGPDVVNAVRETGEE